MKPFIAIEAQQLAIKSTPEAFAFNRVIRQAYAEIHAAAANGLFEVRIVVASQEHAQDVIRALTFAGYSINIVPGGIYVLWYPSDEAI